MELTAFSNADFIYIKRKIQYFMPCSLKERNQFFISYERFRDAWNREKEKAERKQQKWQTNSVEQKLRPSESDIRFL